MLVWLFDGMYLVFQTARFLTTKDTKGTNVGLVVRRHVLA